MILNVKNLTKTFTQAGSLIKAVDDIDFQMTAGESLAIVGPSGSGKTSLLSLLTGLEKADRGKITIDNAEISSMSERELAKFRAQNIGIVFQQFHLMQHLSAAENVALPLEIMSHDNIEKKVEAALKQVGLSDRASHLPNQLSGGECQRVAIARAMVTKPKILFADEPSGNLDTATGKKVMDLLFDLVEKNHMTLILVTHDESLALRCKNILRLTAGKVQ